MLLPPELRVKVYEELLISRSRPLYPNGTIGNGRKRNRDGHQYSEDRVFTSILRTCRAFYEEALPILYGRNILTFHDTGWWGARKLVLPFPKGHLAMVKHVHVDASPSHFGSLDRMGGLLININLSGAKLIDLSIYIYMLEGNGAFRRHYRGISQPPQPFSNFLAEDDPIVEALFSMEPAKSLNLQMDDEARFAPGVADALRSSFLDEGIATGRSITIRKACTMPHRALDLEEPCFRCGNTKESLENGIGYYEYQDDMVTWRLAEQFNKHKRREVLKMIGREVKERKSQNGRRYTTATKKIKAKFVKTFSRSRA